MGAVGDPTWRFYRFGLIVTGKVEADALPHLFRSLAATGRCRFEVIRRIGQRSPRTSPKRRLTVTGTDKAIPDSDAMEIGLPARQYLCQDDAFVILVDDLEHSRRPQARDVFNRYRQALDALLEPCGLAARASVHFFVNMLEAYYLADPHAVSEVLDIQLPSRTDDVETIRNPKAELRRAAPAFDERRDGAEILKRIDVPAVLSHLDTCASLRALFGWCAAAIAETPTTLWQLDRGAYSVVTGPQIARL